MFNFWTKENIDESLKLIKKGKYDEAIAVLGVELDRLRILNEQLIRYLDLTNNIRIRIDQAKKDTQKHNLKDAYTILWDIQRIDHTKLPEESLKLAKKIRLVLRILR